MRFFTGIKQSDKNIDIGLLFSFVVFKIKKQPVCIDVSKNQISWFQFFKT